MQVIQDIDKWTIFINISVNESLKPIFMNISTNKKPGHALQVAYYNNIVI